MTAPHAPTISVPVTSVSGNNLEGSKLLKAVPIGNGLYRLEEANESEMQCDALSKPVYQADITLGNGMTTLSNGITTLSNGMTTFGGTMQTASHFTNNQRHKTSNLVEHRPNVSIAPCTAGGSRPSYSISNSYSHNPYDNTNPSSSTQLDNILQSVLNNINTASLEQAKHADAVPLMIPNGTNSALTSSQSLVTSSPSVMTSSPSTLMINQLIDKLMSLENSDEKILEALNLTIPGITQH